jgi:hypothetical protein
VIFIYSTLFLEKCSDIYPDIYWKIIIPRLANATVIPDAELVYFGKSPEAMENVIEKFPAIDIPNRKIRIFLMMILSIKRTPASRNIDIIKLKNKILFFLKYWISLLRRIIPRKKAKP